MPAPLKSGDIVNDYQILEHLNTGAMAICYAARSPSGVKVFFKQYKSPSVAVNWYSGFVRYQKDLKTRIEESRVRNFCCRTIDSFEFMWRCRTFFQAFEFIKGGWDMEKVLEQARTRPRSITFEQRLILAKVMMAGIDALHEAGIIHADLKPPNIQLLKDSTIVAGYQLRLIDMDFSVLADAKPPWEGFSPYVGSPHYYSPEHLAGRKPERASDVFTCGLILYELLAGGHPYGGAEDDDAFADAVRSYAAPPPVLAGTMPVPASSAQVTDYLHRCLSPNPADRPSARQVNLALNGRVGSAPAAPPKAAPASTPKASRAAPPPTVPAATVGQTLELVGESGRALRIGIKTEIGSYLCRQLGEDARFFHTSQFTISRDDGSWVVIPNASAKNQTLLNGKAVDSTMPLSDGDILAVGNAGRGILKLPMTIRIHGKC